MKVSEFIEWLKEQDQEAIVEVLVNDCDNIKTEEFEPELSDYFDFRGNQFVKENSPHYGKRYLTIGEK